jgi:hypothetical protein
MTCLLVAWLGFVAGLLVMRILLNERLNERPIEFDETEYHWRR